LHSGERESHAMKNATEQWTWSQVNRRDTPLLSVLLMKRDQSVVVAFPRPAGWGGRSEADEQHVRTLLLDAANQNWTVPAKIA